MTKCFDSVYRNALWFKLYKLGVNGRLLRITEQCMKLYVVKLNTVTHDKMAEVDAFFLLCAN